MVEDNSPPEVQAKASEMGWQPPEKFKGDPEKFISAEEFVERGEHMLPLIKATNTRLRDEMTGLSGKVSELTSALSQSQETIQALKEFQATISKQQRERIKAEVKAEILQAREDNDIDAEVQATSKLTEMNALETEEEAPPPKKAPELSPDYLKWRDRNPWFEKDTRRTNLMLALAKDLRENGETSVGEEFFEKAKAELNKLIPFDDQPPPRKVESGGANGDRGNGRTFSDLPADAKAICERQGEKLVGIGKAFKTQAEWRKYYTEQYFGDEQ